MTPYRFLVETPDANTFNSNRQAARVDLHGGNRKSVASYIQERQKVYKFVGECRIFNKDIPDDYLTGIITRPIESVAAIEAIGTCPDCLIATEYEYRFYDDMRMTGRRGGKWGTGMPRKELSLLDRFMDMLCSIVR